MVELRAGARSCCRPRVLLDDWAGNISISIGVDGTIGCERLRVRAAGGVDDTYTSSPEDEGASDEFSVFPAPERVTTFTVRRSGWVVGLGSEIKMVPG